MCEHDQYELFSCSGELGVEGCQREDIGEMKKKVSKRVWLIVIVLVLLGVIVAVGLVKANKEKATQESHYQTHRVKPDNALLLKGKVAAKDTVSVETGVSSTGTLTAVKVKNGEHVEPGTVLMTFHDDQVQSQIDEANQTIDKTNLAIQNDHQAIASLQKQKSTVSSVSVSDDDNGVAADQLQQAKQTLAADQLTLRQAQESLNRLQEKLNPQVTAKISGTVALDDSQTETGMPNMRIISDDQIIDGEVTEYDYAKLKEQMAVKVLPVSNTDRYSGEIVAIAQTPQAEKAATSGQDGGNQAATYQFKVKIKPQLTNGFNVQIRVPQNTIHLPAASLIKHGASHYVYVVRHHRAYRRKVVVKKVAGYWQLMGGVKPHTQIIANPDHQLKDGQKVTLNAD